MHNGLAHQNQQRPFAWAPKRPVSILQPEQPAAALGSTEHGEKAATSYAAGHGQGNVRARQALKQVWLFGPRWRELAQRLRRRGTDAQRYHFGERRQPYSRGVKGSSQVIEQPIEVGLLSRGNTQKAMDELQSGLTRIEQRRPRTCRRTKHARSSKTNLCLI